MSGGTKHGKSKGNKYIAVRITAGTKTVYTDHAGTKTIHVDHTQ